MQIRKRSDSLRHCVRPLRILFLLFLLIISGVTGDLCFCYCFGQKTALAAESSSKSLTDLIKAVRLGEISLEELADALIAEAEESPGIGARLERLQIRFPRFDEILGPKLVASTEAFLVSRTPAEAEGLRALGKKVLKEDDPNFKKVVRYCVLVDRVDKLRTAGKKDELIKLVSSLRIPEEKKLVTARLGGLLTEMAVRTSDKESPFIALKRFAELDVVSDSPKVQDSAVKLLLGFLEDVEQGKVDAREWNFEQPIVQTFLKKLMDADLPEVKEAVLSIYAWRTLDCLKRGDIKSADTSFRFILEQRPDPHPANDELRLEIILGAENEAERHFAKFRFKELKQRDAVGGLDKLLLMFKGYYGSGVIFVFFAAGLGLLIVLIVVAVMISPRVLNKMRVRRRQRQREKSRIVQGPASETKDEYSQLLAFFGLDDSASEKQIKKAFREAVKQCHPDKQGAAGVAYDAAGNLDDTFQDLRKKYERILEIRGAWFGQ